MGSSHGSLITITFCFFDRVGRECLSNFVHKITTYFVQNTNHSNMDLTKVSWNQTQFKAQLKKCSKAHRIRRLSPNRMSKPRWARGNGQYRKSKSLGIMDGFNSNSVIYLVGFRGYDKFTKTVSEKLKETWIKGDFHSYLAIRWWFWKTCAIVHKVIYSLKKASWGLLWLSLNRLSELRQAHWTGGVQPNAFS